MTFRWVRKIFAVLVLALAYFGTGWLGLKWPTFSPSITLIWLPTGLAVAALLRWGFGCWPGVALGAVAVNFANGTAPAAAMSIAIGNTLGPLLAAWMLRRTGFHPAFDRKRDILLLASAAAAGMLVSSSLGTLSLLLWGLLPDERVIAWLTWWGGDAMGVMAAAPLVLACTRREVRGISLRRWEFALWLAALVLTTWAVFARDRGAGARPMALGFLPLPLVAWAALRFGPMGTSLAIIGISLGAAYGTSTGRGPFFQPDAADGAAILWAYMATSVALGWLVTALHAAHVQTAGMQRIFERALSDFSLGVVLAGLDGRITFTNEGFTRLTGYAASEMNGRTCSILQGPETDRAMVERMRAAVRGDGYFDGTVLNYRKNGTKFWNALLISPVRDELGERSGFLGIQRDISKGKETAAELERTLSTLQLLIDTMPALISFVDSEERYRLVNLRYEELFGQRKDQIVGRLVRDVLSPAAYAEIEPHVRAALAGRTERYQWNWPDHDGKTRWMDAQLVPRHAEDGAVVGFFVLVFDVTENKQSEARLRDSEERLRLAMSAAHQGLYDLNVQTGECIVSPEYALMLGYDPAEFCESNAAWRDRMHPDDRDAVYRTYTEYVNGERADYRVEFRQRTKDGGWKWILSLGSLVARSTDGRPLRMLGTHTDITERKMAEEDLRESEERQRILADASFEGIAISAGGVFLDCNDQLAQILRRPRADIIGKRISEFIAPEHRSLVAEAHRTGLLDPFEHQIVRGDGTLRTVAVRARMAQIGGRQLRITAVQDITDRKKGEASLRESEARYRELFEANPHPMWVYDLGSLRFLAVNNAAIAHYGYCREEFLAMTIKDIRPPQDVPALLASVAKVTEGFGASIGWRHRKRDGTLIDVEVTSHVIIFSGCRAEVVLAHDVTERRQSEARLLQAEDAERRRIAKELHDATAQDLVAVIMNLGVLQESLAPGDTKAARILEDSIALVENSVNDIRTLSYVLHPPRLDETGLVGGLAEYAAGFTSRTDTRIHVEADRDFGRLAEDVEIVLFRVVQEAIANVLRHSKSDTAIIRLARRGARVVLEIEDFGRGMADAGARGVGITGMRERLQQLGGRLEIESDSGGTIVRAELPQA